MCSARKAWRHAYVESQAGLVVCTTTTLQLVFDNNSFYCYDGSMDCSFLVHYCILSLFVPAVFGGSIVVFIKFTKCIESAVL